MKKLSLGRTGLMVTQLGFGGIPIQRLTEQESVELIAACLDLGINFVDTANGYTTSEERIGRAIRGRRNELIIASKTGARDRAGARAHLELSLRRLGVGHIDLYQLHNVATPAALAQVSGPGGALEALVEAREQGLIGHIGVSSHSLAVAKDLVRCGQFATLQYPFNFVADEAATELLPLCRERGVGFIAMKPLGGGLIPHGRLAIRYLAQFADVVSDPGIERIEEMRELVAAIGESGELDAADAAEIERVRAELGTRFCHRCDYCQPCPEGIAISTVLAIQSFVRRFPPERAFGEGTASAVLKATTCVECGECESRCPYQLPIREMLKTEAAAYLAARAGAGR